MLLGREPGRGSSDSRKNPDPDYGYDASYVPATSWVDPTGLYRELGAWASHAPGLMAGTSAEPELLWAVRSRPAAPSALPPGTPPLQTAEPQRADFPRLEDALSAFYAPAASHPQFGSSVAHAPATSFEPQPYGFVGVVPWSLLPSFFDWAPRTPTRFFRTDRDLVVRFADGLADEIPLDTIAEARLAEDAEAVAAPSSTTVLAGVGAATVTFPFMGPAALLPGGFAAAAHYYGRKSNPPGTLALYDSPGASRPTHSYRVPRRTDEAYEFVRGLN